MTLPNQLSVLRIILSPVFLILFLQDEAAYKQLSLLVFLIAVLTDWYDGWHARKYGQITKTGIFLDPLADKILTSFAFLLFFFLDIMPLWMVIVIVVRDIWITLLRSYQEYKGQTLNTSYSAKVKTFAQMVYILFILTLLLILSFDISSDLNLMINDFFKSGINYFLMAALTMLTAYTGIQYVFTKKPAAL